jgi:zinc transport system substrate-binding protein
MPASRCSDAARMRVSRRGLRSSAARLFAAAIMLVAVVPAAGCGDEGAAPGDERLLVVTSVPVVYSLTANVAGDAVRLENLLTPGSSPHQVSFTPAQARLVGDADVLIINGAGLEPWVDDLVGASGNKDLRVVVASDGVDFLRPDEPTPVVPGDDAADGTPAAVDPHVWLDPANAQTMVDNIATALSEADPEGSPGYTARADAYKERLAALDAEIREALAPLTQRSFVSFHSAFQYYARAYGLEQAAVIEEFPGKEPSPQYLAGLVDLVDSLGITAVFSEPQFSPRPAEALAREAGVEVYEIDPEGNTLSASEYEDLLRANTDVFVLALGGS